ncbi:MAG: sigma-70 family RNA polymerase sigma factor [Bacteroidota bacterium]
MESGQQTIHKYLVQRSQQGDRQAQNELYKLYVQAMFNICRRMMGDEEEARDVLQEAFVTAFSSINKLKHEVTFSAWLKRIVVNHCLNALKKKRLVTEELTENNDFIQEEEDNTGFVEYETKRIMMAIDKISEGCRTVLNLYLFEGYDHKEIGQILGVSEATSKAQYSKAKSKIRQLLDADMNN